MYFISFYTFPFDLLQKKLFYSNLKIGPIDVSQNIHFTPKNAVGNEAFVLIWSNGTIFEKNENKINSKLKFLIKIKPTRLREKAEKLYTIVIIL